MRITVVCKRLLWIMLVILASMLMIWRFQIASESVRIYQEPTASYYISLGWEILKELTILMPIWLLSLLGLRHFVQRHHQRHAQRNQRHH